ncbi:MAG: hypothetical protein KF860_05465 [Cyclobacteriaceae bacterium]|nr:hypothetical protein [Cyclobacteriaceae bacterium]
MFSISTSWGQTIPPLERELTISFKSVPIEVALSQLSREGKFTFSYSPSILNTSHVVKEGFSKKSVREILNSLFGESITAKGKGNYIILTKTPELTKKEVVNNTVTVSGYVTDENGEKISEVSVFDKKSLAGVITDQFGFFKITLDNPSEAGTLYFSRRTFMDTLATLTASNTQFINMVMRPEKVEIVEVHPADDTLQVVAVPINIQPPVVQSEPVSEKKSFRTFLQEKVFSKNIFSGKKGDANMNNIRDTLHRDFQFSFLPFMGTNQKLSGNVVNDYSLNALGGYSMGTNKLEVGGLFNIDKGNVQHAQFAGLFNTVGGTTKGMQMAGLGNLTRKKVSAAQFAGLFNTNLDSVQGAQFAGLFNVNGRPSKGAQFAGLFNVQPSYYTGSQFAGFLNVATHQMHGTQVAGLINFAHNIKGAQIGLINYADSIKGIPIGLLSFVSNGYHKIELSADEIFYVNAAFRTGVRHFYNILEAGLKPETLNGSYDLSVPVSADQNVWSFGYGVGTAPKLTNWLYLNFDLTANQVNKGSFTNSISLLNKLYVGFDFQVARKFSITAGATLNAYIYDPTYSDNPQLFTDFTPTIIKRHTFSNGNEMEMWWGGKVGIRFL